MFAHYNNLLNNADTRVHLLREAQNNVLSDMSLDQADKERLSRLFGDRIVISDVLSAKNKNVKEADLKRVHDAIRSNRLQVGDAQMRNYFMKQLSTKSKKKDDTDFKTSELVFDMVKKSNNPSKTFREYLKNDKSSSNNKYINDLIGKFNKYAGRSSVVTGELIEQLNGNDYMSKKTANRLLMRNIYDDNYTVLRDVVEAKMMRLDHEKQDTFDHLKEIMIGQLHSTFVANWAVARPEFRHDFDGYAMARDISYAVIATQFESYAMKRTVRLTLPVGITEYEKMRFFNDLRLGHYTFTSEDGMEIRKGKPMSITTQMRYANGKAASPHTFYFDHSKLHENAYAWVGKDGSMDVYRTSDMVDAPSQVAEFNTIIVSYAVQGGAKNSQFDFEKTRINLADIGFTRKGDITKYKVKHGIIMTCETTTENNCLYDAVKFFAEPGMTALQFKRAIGLDRDDMIPLDYMQLVDKVLNVHLHVYIIQEDTEVLTYESDLPADKHRKHVYLLLHKDHYFAYHRYTEIPTVKSAFTVDVTKFTTNHVVVFYDLETIPIYDRLLPLSCAFGSTIEWKGRVPDMVKDGQYIYFSAKRDNVLYMIDYLRYIRSVVGCKTKIVLCAHNGQQFDDYILRDVLLEQGYFVEAPQFGKNVYSIKASRDGICVIDKTFDTLKIAPFSLKYLSNSFKIESKKKSFDFYEVERVFGRGRLRNLDLTKVCLDQGIVYNKETTDTNKVADYHFLLHEGDDKYLLEGGVDRRSIDQIDLGFEQVQIELGDKLKEYNCYDILALMQVFSKLNDMFDVVIPKLLFKREMPGLMIKKKTIGSISKFNCDQMSSIFSGVCPDIRTYRYCHGAMIGGRSQCFRRGIFTDRASFDVCSLYPFVMWLMTYPYGDLIETPVYVPGKLGIYTCTIDQTNLKYCIIPCAADSDSLDWCHHMPFTREITNVDIECLMKYGCKVLVHKGCYFTQTCTPFKDYIDILFKLKKEQDFLKATGDKRYNPALRECVKLALNSVFGKNCEGIHMDYTRIIAEFKPEKYADIKISDVTRVGKRMVVSGKYTEEYITRMFDGKKNSVAGIFILAYARSYMYDFIDMFQEDIIFMDTDSIHISKAAGEYLYETFPKLKPGDITTSDGKTLKGADKNLGQFEDELSKIKNNIEYTFMPKVYCVTSQIDGVEYLGKARFKGVNFKTDQWRHPDGTAYRLSKSESETTDYDKTCMKIQGSDQVLHNENVLRMYKHLMEHGYIDIESVQLRKNIILEASSGECSTSCINRAFISKRITLS